MEFSTHSIILGHIKPFQDTTDYHTADACFSTGSARARCKLPAEQLTATTGSRVLAQPDGDGLQMVPRRISSGGLGAMV